MPYSKRTVAWRAFEERARWSHACGIVRGSQTAAGLPLPQDLALARPSPDSDANGSLDWWEDQHGMDKYDPADGAVTPVTGGGGTTGAGGNALPSTFVAWHPLWFPNASVDLNTAAVLDADGDGISNVLESAFDLI